MCCTFSQARGEDRGLEKPGLWVVSHGLVKEQAVPDAEIDRAIERKRRFEANPERHSFDPSLEKMTKNGVKKTFHSEALQYTYDKFIGNDPEQVADYEQDLIGIEVAKRIYDLRTKAGLTPRELARKVGTTASVICRLEDADYEGRFAIDDETDCSGS